MHSLPLQDVAKFTKTCERLSQEVVEYVILRDSTMDLMKGLRAESCGYPRSVQTSLHKKIEESLTLEASNSGSRLVFDFVAHYYCESVCCIARTDGHMETSITGTRI